MEKALEIINSNKIYIEIFKNVMKKYKQYSKITGYFNINPKNNEEMDILASFDTNVYNNKKAKIKSKDVEKLFTKKLKNFDFLQLLSVVTKEELITNKQVREILVNNEVEFFSTLIKFCENGIGKEWIISALQKKLYGYPSIKKLYKKALDESNINYLKEDLIKCINAINNLPYLENKYESLAIFSARHTKDPHFFDKDSIYGKLLINALVYKDSQGVNKNEINKILLDSFDHVKIGIAKNQALFEMENCKVVTRTLDGEFLNYKSVIPSNWETRIRVNKNSLQDSFERISLISASSIEKEKKYPVKVSVDIGKITISCTNQTGEAKEEIYISTEGKNIEAGFNPKYFLDSLKAIDDEEVFVEFGTSISPCLIKSVENSEYVYMILPIRLKE